jgi:hypothetical protein
LAQTKRLDHLGLILAKTHQDGLYYGAEADTTWPLPNVEGAENVSDTAIWEHYDEGMIEMPGLWTTDSRLHLLGYAPRPVTVMAAIISITTSG